MTSGSITPGSFCNPRRRLPARSPTFPERQVLTPTPSLAHSSFSDYTSNCLACWGCPCNEKAAGLHALRRLRPFRLATVRAKRLECGVFRRFAYLSHPVKEEQPAPWSAVHQKRRNTAHSKGFARFDGPQCARSVWSARSSRAFASEVVIHI